MSLAGTLQAASTSNCSLQSRSESQLIRTKFQSHICVPSQVRPTALQSSARLTSAWLGSVPRKLHGNAVGGSRSRQRAVRIEALKVKENEYIVELEKPIGIKFYKGLDGQVYVDALAPGQTADLSGKFEAGDRVVATSAVFGDEMWPAAEYGRTMYAVRQRAGLLVIHMEKRFGEKTPIFKVNDQWMAERNSGNYGDALREKQIENYTKVQELKAAREAEVTAGLKLYKEGKYEEALVRFETLLGLQPLPRERAVASYNLACCYSKLGNIKTGLAALEDSMEAGFDDYKAVRQDPDLQPLRDSEEFPTLINRYDEPLFDENVIKAFKNMFGFMKK